MATLFEISADLIELDRALADLEGMPEDQAIAMEAWLNGIANERKAELDAKLDNYAALIQEVEARGEARKVEAKRLSDRAQIDLNKAKSLKISLQKFFERHDLKAVETARYRLTLAKNGGKLPMFVDYLTEDQLALLPSDYIKAVTTVSLDKDYVRGLLESGSSLGFARLGERGQSMRIK